MDDSPNTEGATPVGLDVGNVGSRRVRRGPAAIFLGLVAIIGVGGFAGAALTSSPSRSTAATLGAPKGSSIDAVRASGDLKKIMLGGEPPTDIVGALVVPAGSSLLNSATGNQDLDLYDASITLGVPDRPGDVVTFYKLELKDAGWKVDRVDATANGKGSELFATKGSSDGFYWEVGVVIDPANPSITPALAGNDATASSSTVELRIFEIDDAD